MRSKHQHPHQRQNHGSAAESTQAAEASLGRIRDAGGLLKTLLLELGVDPDLESNSCAELSDQIVYALGVASADLRELESASVLEEKLIHVTIYH